MTKKIHVAFGLLLLIFLGGSIIAAVFITKTTQRMDKLIMLHQVEILREDLIIHIQQVQSHIYRDKVRSGRDMDILIAQVRDMDRIMDSCVGCHHPPELAQGLIGLRDMANDYKTAINRLITTPANPEQIGALYRRAQDLGQELITMTQGMAFTANIRLQQKTQETMETIRAVRNVLYGTLLLGFLLAIGTAYLLAKSLDERLRKLLEATRRIAQGAFEHRIDFTAAEGNEFKELGESFNMMTQNLHRSQRQLVQRAKLAAIGELATNIVYEVNNPLTAVLGYTGLLVKADDIPPDRREQLKTIEREALRARGILKNLLDFSRRQPPRLIKTDVSGLVSDTLSLVQDKAQMSKIEIISFCPAGLPPIAADANELKQVFGHLISNAFFAMPGGGTLTIRCRKDSDHAGKNFVIIEVADTGRGIPDEHLDNIFDPFFTTRLDGEGTGLGLTTSYMIVQNHGGRIEVESKVKEGSVFKVILPECESL